MNRDEFPTSMIHWKFSSNTCLICIFVLLQRRNYATQISIKDHLLEQSKEIHNNCINSCKNISSCQSDTTKCKLRLNATEALLVECNSKKEGFTNNDLLKFQIEENAKMMNKCLDQPNTKVVERSGTFSSGTNKYNTSSPHCDTIAKQYEKYNMISLVYGRNNHKQIEKEEQSKDEENMKDNSDL